MNSIYYKDLYRYIGNDCKSIIYRFRYLIFTPGFRYIYFLRKAAASKFTIQYLFWKFLLRMCMYRTGIQIPPETQIGEGFRIVHFGAIVVNPKAIIGKNFNICQGCLIGSSLGKKSGYPIIGDNVCMQPNSMVVGGVTIGNNVLIAPGAFVNTDVPSHSVVIGNPAVIIPKNNPTDKYIVYKA